MSKSVARLFSQFQPAHYALSLDLDKSAMHYTGLVTIRGKKVGRPSERITLKFSKIEFAYTPETGGNFTTSWDLSLNAA